MGLKLRAGPWFRVGLQKTHGPGRRTPTRQALPWPANPRKQNAKTTSRKSKTCTAKHRKLAKGAQQNQPEEKNNAVKAPLRSAGSPGLDLPSAQSNGEVRNKDLRGVPLGSPQIQIVSRCFKSHVAERTLPTLAQL